MTTLFTKPLNHGLAVPSVDNYQIGVLVQQASPLLQPMLEARLKSSSQERVASYWNPGTASNYPNASQTSKHLKKIQHRSSIKRNDSRMNSAFQNSEIATSHCFKRFQEEQTTRENCQDKNEEQNHSPKDAVHSCICVHDFTRIPSDASRLESLSLGCG